MSSRFERHRRLHGRRFDAEHPSFATRLHVAEFRRFLGAWIPDHDVGKVGCLECELALWLTQCQP